MSRENLQLLCIDPPAAWTFRCEWAYETPCGMCVRVGTFLPLVLSHYWLPWGLQLVLLSQECAESGEMMWIAWICMRNAWIIFLGFGDAAGRRLDLNFRTVFYYSLSRNWIAELKWNFSVTWPPVSSSAHLVKKPTFDKRTSLTIWEICLRVRWEDWSHFHVCVVNMKLVCRCICRLQCL